MRHRRTLSLSVAILILSTAAMPLRAGDVLFPTPLHLTRRIQESIGGSATTVEQYCHGNRVITVSGSITTIADYDKSDVTEIDRSAGTWSVSRFDQVAKALHPQSVPTIASDTKQEWKLRKSGRNEALSTRSGEIFEGDRTEAGMTRHVRIGIDSSVPLSKDALEVLIGSAYPGSPKDEDAAIFTAAKGDAPTVASTSLGGSKPAATYGLPVEQLFRFEAEGQHAEYRDVVLRVGNEVPPADLVAIPPGATLVESRLIKTTRLLDAIDRLPLSGLKVQ